MNTTPLLRHRMAHVAVAALLFLLISLASAADVGRRLDAAPAQSPDRVALTGHVLPALALATMDTSKAATIRDDEPLTLTIVLNRSDPYGFAVYLADVYDAASLNFRKFLTPTEVSDRFGPTTAQVDAIIDFANENGLQVSWVAGNRMTVSLIGNRATTEHAFLVRIGDYKRHQQSFFANDREPSMPAKIAGSVHAVIGLSNSAVPARKSSALLKDANDANAAANCANDPNTPTTEDTGSIKRKTKQDCLNDYKKAAAGYNDECKLWHRFIACRLVLLVPAPPGAGAASEPGMAVPSTSAPPAASGDPTSFKRGGQKALNGTGQKIGIVAFDSYRPSDVRDFLELVGAPATQIGQLSNVAVNGGAALGASQSEVLLDIGTVMTGAQGAAVVVYSAPFGDSGSSYQPIFNRMITDGVTVISNSWSYCESQTTLADVQSIDSILATAAASGISVLNASGDSGSTCLDGSANTVGVPASSPHATAVGGTTLTIGPAGTYGGETWWNTAASSPPGGAGGFGVSRFFARPAYQDALSTVANRSLPDIAIAADPNTNGVPICRADAGGCPTGDSFGGTSYSAPLMAGLVAVLNQARGHNLGFLNPQLYALADSAAFQNAASMGSDFSHVGLGSPNVSSLSRALNGQGVGTPDASMSVVGAQFDEAPADGQFGVGIVVQLRDANGSPVSGKTVRLSANSSSSAVISPPSAVTTTDGGSVLFSVKDSVTEVVTLSAIDDSDGIVLSATVQVKFVVPPAVGGSIVALSGTAAADGISTDIITVTLQDTLGRPTPGKRVRLEQTGNAVIKVPSLSRTNASGQIQFTVTNTKQESVLFVAFDQSDGDLRVPGVAGVTFSASGGSNCGSTHLGDPNIHAASGYAMSAFATGFRPNTINFGNVAGCRGAGGMAFDPSGNLFVADGRSGNIYKFGSSGGTVGAPTLVTTLALEPSISGLTFGLDGKLYAAFYATTGDFFTGAVREINPANGTIVRTVSTAITCAAYLVTDPISGDLFVDDPCYGSGSDNGSIWRIANPGSASPTTSVYAATSGFNGGLTFSSGGTLYVLDYVSNGVTKVTGTNKPQPAQKTTLPGLTGPALNIVALGAQANGDAKTLLVSSQADASGFPAGMKAFDVTTNPVSTISVLVNNAFAVVQLTGPDGCQYASMWVAVYKITNADGSCPLVFGAPTLTLNPAVVAPNAVQGSSKSFTATFHYTTVPTGTPVFFQVAGANSSVKLVNTDANGRATMTYVGAKVGDDLVIAAATVDTSTFTSNIAKVTWNVGLHVASLDLNSSPTGGVVGTPSTLSAALVDLSVTPVATVVGVSVRLSVGSQSCDAVTTASGVASCNLTPSTVGNFTLTASFAGNAQYTSATVSTSFAVTARLALDIDGDGIYDALTDGTLIIRWMSNASDPALANAAIGTNATRRTAADISAYLTTLGSLLDIDGNGQIEPLKDGVLILRYLFGFRGDALINGAVGANPARFTPADIEAYLRGLTP